MTRQQVTGSLGAVVYCRVSTREQAEEGVSLGSQERTCREFCRQRGWSVRRVFVEKGESARTTDRPEFTEMIRWCRHHRSQLDVLLVYKLDRFCRNKTHFFALQALLANYGIRIVSATEPVEDDSPIARLLEGILASIGEFESDLIADRTRTSMEQARQIGRPTHRPPLGYLMARDRSGAPTLLLDPERAPIIKRGFERYATGLFTLRETLRMMSSEGLTTRSGKALTVQVLHRMMNNPVYAGRIIVSEQKGQVEGNFEGLVSEDLFDRIRLVQTSRRAVRTWKPDTADFPLRYFIRCGVCGKYLTGGWSTGRAHRRYPYYYCYRSGCRAVHAGRDALERSYLEFLDGLAAGSERAKRVSEMLSRWAEDWAPEAEELSRKESARLREIEEQVARLTKAYVYERAMDRAFFTTEKDRLDEEALILKLDLEDIPDPGQARLSAEVADWLSGQASELVCRTARKHRPQLQRTLFPDGLDVDPESGGVRTALTCCSPNPWTLSEGCLSRLATPTGLEPVSPA